MFEERLIKLLRKDESIVTVFRKYLLVFWWPLFMGSMCIIAPFFFLVPLFHWGMAGVGLFIALLLLGILIVIRVIILYSFNVFIITTERIIDINQLGFFHRTVSETTYDKIQDVSYTIKGIVQTLFHFGNINIQTAGQLANLELDAIKNPEHVQQTIIRIQQESKEDARHGLELKNNEIHDSDD